MPRAAFVSHRQPVMGLTDQPTDVSGVAFPGKQFFRRFTSPPYEPGSVPTRAKGTPHSNTWSWYPTTTLTSAKPHFQ